MNFQNIPRGDKVVKRAFVPKLDAFLFADYSQIELRLLAYYMAQLGDPSMAQAFIQGKDLHTESSKGALKIAHEPDDEQRQVGKVMNYSLIYGGGAPTIMRQLGVDFSDAKEYIAGFHSRWPGIKIVQLMIERRLQSRGYITDLYGRKLRPESEHKALNALVQGSASSLLRASAVEVDRYIQRERMVSHIVNLIHDEIMSDVAKAELDALAEAMPVLMRHDEVHEIVPITVDCEVSFTNWAEKEPYERRVLVA